MFRDLAALIEAHFNREEHELLLLARDLLGEDELRELCHEYEEESIMALRTQRGGRDAPRFGLLAGALVGAAAGAIAFAAWGSGALRGLTGRRPSFSCHRRRCSKGYSEAAGWLRVPLYQGA